MGVPAALEASPAVDGLPGTAVSMGNPHVVVELADLEQLGALDLARPPSYARRCRTARTWSTWCGAARGRWRCGCTSAGVGETRSCGTGVCAAVVAAVAWSGGDGLDDPWTVDVPGGRLSVTWLSAGPVLLSGPAVLVAHAAEVDTAALPVSPG